MLAGLEGRLRDGRTLSIRPSPRRAVGPDLAALFLGGGERFATIEHAWLRVHPKGVRRVALATDGLRLEAPVSAEESLLLDAIARELGRPA